MKANLRRYFREKQSLLNFMYSILENKYYEGLFKQKGPEKKKERIAEEEFNRKFRRFIDKVKDNKDRGTSERDPNDEYFNEITENTERSMKPIEKIPESSLDFIEEVSEDSLNSKNNYLRDVDEVIKEIEEDEHNKEDNHNASKFHGQDTNEQVEIDNANDDGDTYPKFCNF